MNILNPLELLDTLQGPFFKQNQPIIEFMWQSREFLKGRRDTLDEFRHNGPWTEKFIELLTDRKKKGEMKDFHVSLSHQREFTIEDFSKGWFEMEEAIARGEGRRRKFKFKENTLQRTLDDLLKD